MTNWVSSAYTVMALIAATLLVYVMQKVEYDRWSKTDALWLQWVRRFAFVSTALVLLYSINSADWQLTALLCISGGSVILAINALALHLRVPPKDGRRIRHGMQSHPHGFSRLLVRVAHYFSHSR